MRLSLESVAANVAERPEMLFLSIASDGRAYLGVGAELRGGVKFIKGEEASSSWHHGLQAQDASGEPCAIRRKQPF